MNEEFGAQVEAGGWQGSRGDVRLLARLGLSQAGLQDERDAEERAVAAKNRWRRKSSSKGQSLSHHQAVPVEEKQDLQVLASQQN